MANRITLEVTRYDPTHDQKPRLESYEVPLRKEWVVLDALNYIKDHLDGSLSFRWGLAGMGVCGSCGMTVNGVPKLTCATFLSEYAPGPVRVRPMNNFPILRDLVVTPRISGEAHQVETLDHSKVGKSLWTRKYLQTQSNWRRINSFSMCIIACCVTRPVRFTDGPAISVDLRPLPWAQRYKPGLPDQGPVSGSISSRNTMESGDARLSANAPRFVPRMWTPPAPSAVQANGHHGMAEGFGVCREERSSPGVNRK